MFLVQRFGYSPASERISTQACGSLVWPRGRPNVSSNVLSEFSADLAGVLGMRATGLGAGSFVGGSCAAGSVSPVTSLRPFIVVAGDIASGKTTMARALAESLGLPAFLEQPDRNPFLDDFYTDAKRWGFASQLWFLLGTLEHQRNAQAGGVQDHSTYENVHVYDSVLRARGDMTQREYDALIRLQRFCEPLLRAPDVIVLLNAPVEELKSRIVERGRKYERRITDQYLEQLVATRQSFFASWTACPVLPVRTDVLDPRRKTDLAEIVERIRMTIPSKVP